MIFLFFVSTLVQYFFGHACMGVSMCAFGNGTGHGDANPGSETEIEVEVCFSTATLFFLLITGIFTLICIASDRMLMV